MTNSGAFRQQVEAMAQEYRAALPAMLVELDRLRQAARQESAASQSLPALLALRRALHSLAGAAGTFGLAGLTDAARAAERFLDPCCDGGSALGPADHAALERLLDAVRSAAAPPP
jgi:chemotaxis protein histidine kinase CheA